MPGQRAPARFQCKDPVGTTKVRSSIRSVPMSTSRWARFRTVIFALFLAVVHPVSQAFPLGIFHRKMLGSEAEATIPAPWRHVKECWAHRKLGHRHKSDNQADRRLEIDSVGRSSQVTTRSCRRTPIALGPEWSDTDLVFPVPTGPPLNYRGMTDDHFTPAPHLRVALRIHHPVEAMR